MRIVEALAAEALRRLGQTPNPTVFVNLQVLEQLGQVGTSAAYWAHALRRLGNRVRHVQGAIGPDDATLAALFAERWLAWFFRRFNDGQQPFDLTSDGQPLWLEVGAELSAVLRSLEALEAGAATDLTGSALAASSNPALLQTPVTVALFAEILLALSGPGDATVLQVLEAGLTWFPQDVRLRQVMGLFWRRERQPARALTWLEPLLKERPDDEETIGIMAGACKGLWELDRTNQDPLLRAHRLYRRAWKRSGRESAYMGINAAATALWLGQGDLARQQAAEVDALLRRRTAGCRSRCAIRCCAGASGTGSTWPRRNSCRATGRRPSKPTATPLPTTPAAPAISRWPAASATRSSKHSTCRRWIDKSKVEKRTQLISGRTGSVSCRVFCLNPAANAAGSPGNGRGNELRPRFDDHALVSRSQAHCRARPSSSPVRGSQPKWVRRRVVSAKVVR